MNIFYLYIHEMYICVCVTTIKEKKQRPQIIVKMGKLRKKKGEMV